MARMFIGWGVSVGVGVMLGGAVGDGVHVGDGEAGAAAAGERPAGGALGVLSGISVGVSLA